MVGTCIFIAVFMGIAAALSGQSDSLLTRDYLYPDHPQHIVMKGSGIVCAALVPHTIRCGEGTRRGPLTYLSVMVRSSQDLQTMAECSKEKGQALLSILKERYLLIETFDGQTVGEQQFDQAFQQIKAGIKKSG